MRTSVAGAVASTMSDTDVPGTLKGTRSDPRGTRASGITARTTVPRVPTMRTSSPAATPRRSMSSGWRWAELETVSGSSDGDKTVPTARSYSWRDSTRR